jgi:enoyl-CoA hydratase/carnithine racemase
LLDDRFSAADAESAGITIRAVTSADLEEKTAKLTNRLVTGPTQAYGRTKQCGMMHSNPAYKPTFR